MKGFAPTLMDQEMNERLEDPAQGEKSQWDAFAERNRDAAATKGVVTLRGREIGSLSRDISSNSWSCRLVTDQSLSTTGSSLRDELAFFRGKEIHILLIVADYEVEKRRGTKNLDPWSPGLKLKQMSRGSPVISSKKRKMKGFVPRLMDQEMNKRLEDPAQGEKSQWDAFAERNKDGAATKVLTWEADLDLKRSGSPVISSKKRKMKGFAPRLMDQEMNERLEDPAQGEKSQWDAFAERNRDAAATKVLTWEADLDLKRSVTIIQKEKDRTKEGGDDGPRMGF
uniref:Uncharacterized protein n=2 Tax=Tanacetum TaxID=99105 RepID=A0A699GKM0_TANCI|nr:hypothetical protein [Tanacetum cinerariifolium]